MISASAEARTTCQTHACDARVKAKQWRHLQARLSPESKQMLARLRGCETRGMAFPANYRASGHHFGAYQYTWGPGSAGARAGFRVRPDRASPAEQDVRTARFYPAHRSGGRAARRAARDASAERRRPDSNRSKRLCRPLRSHSATAPRAGLG